MNILLINGTDPFKAAGAVALDLFHELKIRGHRVVLVTHHASQCQDGIIQIESSLDRWWKKNKIRNKFIYLQSKYNLKRTVITDPKYDFFEFDENRSSVSSEKLLKKASIQPDVILVLFAKKFLNTRNLFELNKITGAPVYWLMYDMAPLTGGCHYAWDCTGYQKDCSSCPGILDSGMKNRTLKNLRIKKENLEKTDIHLLAASGWQYNQAHKSALFRNKPVHQVLISVNPEVFKPVKDPVIKKQFSIHPEKKTVFFGSISLATERKGMRYLIDGLNILSNQIKGTDLEGKILLLIAGTSVDEIRDELPFDYHFLGLLNNSDGIASAYQAADLFICPSVEDSGPTMINQSMMCGTPVVAFEMGVAPDLIDNGETGYLARVRDPEDLSEGIFKVLSQSPTELQQMKDRCRDLALKLYSPEVQISRLEYLFNQDKRI